MSEEAITTGVEESTVAESIGEETGVEEQEVASPVSEESAEPTGKTEEDAAWARMRREAEQARKDAEAARQELAEMKASAEARSSAISRLTGRGEDAEIAALAEVTGMSEDEVAEIYEREAELAMQQLESEKKDERIEELEEIVGSIQAERLMQVDLERLRKIDPSLNSLEDLGPEYARYMSVLDPETGEPIMQPEDAYWAIKAKERANQATPPKEIGKVATGTAEKTRYSQAEIDAMSSDQLKKNWRQIIASWDE